MVRAVKRSTMRGAGTTGGQSPATMRSRRGRPSVSSRIRSALASSVYDLDAHRWHGRHQDMGLDEALVARASPLRNPPLDARLPMSLSVGADETPEMQRQTRDYHAMLVARGHPVALHVEPGLHHLSMGRAFAQPACATFRALRHLLEATV